MLKITPKQAQTYRVWVQTLGLPFEVSPLHAQYRLHAKKTAKKLGIRPERVRFHVAKVIQFLEEGGELPPEEDCCYRCYATGDKIKRIPDRKSGNKQYYCLNCEKTFVLVAQNQVK